MPIFTGGKSTAINSPRHLTLRHARRAIRLKKLSLGILAADEELTEPNLKPTEERLNSFWSPGLTAGHSHHVGVKQVIHPAPGDGPSPGPTEDPDNHIKLTAKQDFSVDAPQFTLPEGSIHSMYPPPGYSDDHRILPHVVLTDPHLPWERRGSPKTGEDKFDRNRVPWLALFSFTQDGLSLAPDVLHGENSIFPQRAEHLAQPLQHMSTLAVNMTIEDLSRSADIASPVKHMETERIKDSRGDFIFIKQDLFTSLFSTFDKSNNRQVPGSPDTSQYKFLSHVREINTTGMAIAGVEHTGIFSVVIGNRSGPLDNPGPTSIAVHLVSIEGVEAMRFPIRKSHVALCSLHSWNYTVMPPRMLNVGDTFQSLGQTLTVLRPPDAVIAPLKSAGQEACTRLASRLEDGYSLVKYRTQTGEQTVAMLRGPFTPTVVPDLLMNDCSNSGLDLQILDKQVGIMDITYSSAWQLGRTLALGDRAFTAAVGRLRAAIHKRAMKSCKRIVVCEKSKNNFRTSDGVLRGLPTLVRNLDRIYVTQHQGSGAQHMPFKPGGSLKRWHRRRLHRSEIPGLPFSAPKIEEHYLEQAIDASRELAMSTDGCTYDEFNNPVSTDWMIVLAWVMDRMSLAGVPAHYLITNPSHLTEESLRFFHIDPNWVDAMVDGALSLANHMGNDKDRVAIKTALNDFIQNKSEYLCHPPQIPTYGFFLRSDLVTMFPDLRVTTMPAQPDPPPRAPLLRHEILTDGVMLGLLDRIPGSEEFKGLVFTQPPHQQRFAVAQGLETDSIKVHIRRQYTVDQSIQKKDPFWREPLNIQNLPSKPIDTDNLFIWGSTPSLTDLHIMRLPHFADVQQQALVDNMGSVVDGSTEIKFFDDDTATSALFALQLNDPIYTLTVDFKSFGALTALASLDDERQGPRKEPDHDGSPTSASFERLHSYKPAPHALAFLAPHVRAIPSMPTPTLSTILSLVTSRPSSSPVYNCKIYTPQFTSVYIGDHLPQDLVFSVIVENNKHSSYRLEEFDIEIGLGGLDSPTNKLMKGYDGPGPSMISNLRFNVLPSFSTANNMSSLRLRLLPRSSKENVLISSVDEISFILCSAKVNEFDRRETYVTVKTSADYENSHTIEGIPFEVPVINTNFNPESTRV
ncbi:hypothetical protein N7471_010525 [Penicillium samsonianum]|uniref:uncharacterized protein n=1 Tax=Penicillium samsonianum TaxID=1882272 RepID=UPI00254709F0|nr:uncharacterized protein N7471_010525 [Penicillium samsonianum]KAJ6126032.1 hypothetical protein N7471_010525 [Penicillium samsonianum]